MVGCDPLPPSLFPNLNFAAFLCSQLPLTRWILRSDAFDDVERPGMSTIGLFFGALTLRCEGGPHGLWKNEVDTVNLPVELVLS